ncbi:uncharacterized protein LOC107040399 [Diachasma alloeum]|uniref:uncharacterized protein LOC107040399 n=1 Tax=Diachasma alloeum TaxID=454923 RepID=UPI0007381CD7|nr:uncharacterized protein LOC107040399 [Diachasma alloeum]
MQTLNANHRTLTWNNWMKWRSFLIFPSTLIPGTLILQNNGQMTMQAMVQTSDKPQLKTSDKFQDKTSHEAQAKTSDKHHVTTKAMNSATKISDPAKTAVELLGSKMERKKEESEAARKYRKRKLELNLKIFDFEQEKFKAEGQRHEELLSALNEMNGTLVDLLNQIS